jgi:hypothetical protein
MRAAAVCARQLYARSGGAHAFAMVGKAIVKKSSSAAN